MIMALCSWTVLFLPLMHARGPQRFLKRIGSMTEKRIYLNLVSCTKKPPRWLLVKRIVLDPPLELKKVRLGPTLK